MMDKHLDFLAKYFKADSISKVELIQPLWSNYGQLCRVYFDSNSVIVKLIKTSLADNHPRGWNTAIGHQRKVKSYTIESHWYEHWAKRCNNLCRLPEVHLITAIDGDQLIVLEDLLTAGYTIKKSSLSFEQAKLGLRWMANFHAIFMNEEPTGLWNVGSYWHLDTRPDEYHQMEDGLLKQYAQILDERLNECTYKTIIHGDAKVANFCFNEAMTNIAAVDFQYVGGGCGMKDVIYFLSSCITEEECEMHESEVLDYYFSQLKIALDKTSKKFNFNDLEDEWRYMYRIAWVDFIRFLKGWAPDHYKINTYSERILKETLARFT